MNWFKGPFDSHEFLFGIQIFWWIRAVMGVQLCSGLLAATGLLSRDNKEAIHKWMASQKNEPLKPEAPLWRIVLKFMLMLLVIAFVLALILSVAVAFFAAPDGTPWSAVFSLAIQVFPTAFLFTFALAVLLGAILGMLVNIVATTVQGSVRGFRFVLSKVAGFFGAEHFDRTALLISVILFVIASGVEIYLS